jgi:acyl-lipid omega-6 desaturase (Delta-12 desaturase)
MLCFKVWKHFKIIASFFCLMALVFVTCACSLVGAKLEHKGEHWINIVNVMDKQNSQQDEWSRWIKIIKRYNQPSTSKSWWQIINSFVPYFVLWVAMVYSLQFSYWLTLALSVLATGFLVRIFIIFHDCGHGSFFKSPLLNRIVGIIGGGLVFTPYHKWHYEHMLHHQTVGNLDKRGNGDVMTLTVEEYKNRASGQRFFYRAYRNPIILFLIAPIFLFSIAFRFPGRGHTKRMNLYTHLTTLGLIAAIFLVSYFIGFKAFLMIQIPILFFATVFGVWLFYVQHQFKEVVWERTPNWDYKSIAMNGCSFFKLPRILQWFSGNIGFHHIHHLSPMVPNYNLEKCMIENPIFQKEPLSLWQSFQSVKYRLWDEQKHKIVSFKEALNPMV